MSRKNRQNKIQIQYMKTVIAWGLIITMFLGNSISVIATENTMSLVTDISGEENSNEVAEEVTGEENSDEITEEATEKEDNDEIAEEVTEKENSDEIAEEITGKENSNEIEEKVADEKSSDENIEEVVGEENSDEITEEVIDGQDNNENTKEITEEEENILMAASSDIVYTDGSVNSDATQDGSYEYPYKNLPDAIAACSEGGVVIVKSGGGYANDTSSTDSPLLITKKLTIKGEEGSCPTINIRNGSIILGGDTTIENVSLSIANTTFKGIFANGYELNLTNVSNSNSEIVLPDVYVGSYAGYIGEEVTTDTADSCGKVVICGANSKFNEVYAGSLGNTWAQNAEIYIMDDGSNSLNAVYSCGQNEEGERENVDGNVTITLTNPSVKRVYGYVNETRKAEVIFSDEYANSSLFLSEVGKLTVSSGTYIPSILDDGMNLVIPKDAILDLSVALTANPDLCIHNFEGGGTLRMNQEQCITIDGTISEVTNFQTNENLPMDNSCSGIVAENHVYIVTSAETAETAFTFVPYVTQEDLYLAKKTKDTLAEWTIVGEESSELPDMGSGEYEPYWSDGNYSNLIVFVDFADTSHQHKESSFGECLKSDSDTTFKYFNGSETDAKGMRQYLYNISYGQLKVENIFPQYDYETDSIIPYTLKNNASYYAQNRDAMLEEIIDAVNASGQISDKMKLNLHDQTQNVLDNLTIVVACETENTNSLFSGVMTTYFGSKEISGKLVRKYNIVTESGIYFSMSNSGVIIHEFMHTLGFPDLYRSGSGLPVGTWDIMSSESSYVQYPLAYMRSAYGKWFTIPTLTESANGITLPAASKTTAENKDRQALILKTDYSDTEFFVVEYRKQGAAYSEEYEVKIPGSGLIVYRINTEQITNFIGPPDMVYIFRPGDNFNSNGYENGSGNIYNAHLSSESGRTSYGSSNFADSLAEGAITYSDGRNSGIVISNVGSADGEEISFDITYTEPEEGMWSTVGKEVTGGSIGGASYMDPEGNTYFVLKKADGAGLYQYTDEGFVKLGNVPAGSEYTLSKYNNTLYLAYVTDSTMPLAKLDRWEGANWVNVHTSATKVSYANLSLCSDNEGVYFAYVDLDSANVYAVQVTQAGVTTTVAGTTSDYAANPSIAAENGKLAISYREFFNNDKIVVKVYNQENSSWELVANPALQGIGLLKIYKGMLYLLQSGTYANDYECYLFSYDLLNEESTWKQLGNSYFTNVNSPEYDFTFINNNPHIIYMEGVEPYAVLVKYLSEEGDWVTLGDCVAKAKADGLGLFEYQNQLYATYINVAESSQKAFIRNNRIEAPEIIIPRYEWVLKYGYGQDGNLDSIITVEEVSIDSIISNLRSLPADAGDKIFIGYKGEEKIQSIPEDLLSICAQKEWALEFCPKLRTEETQISWFIDGLDAEEIYESSMISALISEDDAELPEELKEEGCLQIWVDGLLPSNAQVKLILSGQEISDVFNGKSNLFQWKNNNGSLALDREITEYQFGTENKIVLQLSEPLPDSYVITSQAPYGWVLVTTDNGDCWSYIEHRTMEPVKGWAVVNGKKCFFDDYGYLYEGIHKVEGKWYLFGEKENETQGILSGLQSCGEAKYYADDNGVLKAGWYKIDNEWSYFSAEEENYGSKLPTAARGYWIDIGENAGALSGRNYYFRNNTVRVKGWQTIDKKRYYFHNDGYAMEGWYPAQNSKRAYYFDSLGAMTTGYCEVEGDYYYFDKNGIRLTGWQKENDVWHYFSSEQGDGYGKEVESVNEGMNWYSMNQARYYFANNRSLTKGWKTIDNKKYYFDQTGKCAEGTVKIGNGLYHFYQDESKQNVLGTGLFQDGENYYYANSSGRLQTGFRKIDGIWRYFNTETGAEEQCLIQDNCWAIVGSEKSQYFYMINGNRMATGWRTIDGKRYYFGQNGMLCTGFFIANGNVYYADIESAPGEGLGEISVGLKEINGEKYYFSQDGKMLTGFQKINQEWRFFSTAPNYPERGKECTLSLGAVEGNYYWYQIEDVYYCMQNNKSLLKGWKTISGNRYYFDTKTGAAIRGCEYVIGRDTYCFDENGVMRKNVVHNGYGYNGRGIRVKGWQTIEGNRYYFDKKTGVLKTGDINGVLELDGKKYYLGDDGILKTDWIIGSDGKTYYADSRGVMLKGWQKIQKKWYYFDLETGVRDESAYVSEDYFAYATQDGKLQTYYLENGRRLSKGFKTISGKKYYFDSATGQRLTGFFKVGSAWYYYQEDGTPKKGKWHNTENNNTYYFNSSGRAVTGWQTIEGSRYYFAADGVMQKQRVKIGNTYYFFGPTGKMRTGFVNYCDTTYYFNERGVMQKGWRTIDRERYYFDKEGAMVTGFLTEGKSTYYLDERNASLGQMLTGEQKIGEATYYFNSRGIMLKGWQKIDSVWHYFDAKTGRELRKSDVSQGWIDVLTLTGKVETAYIFQGRTVYKGFKTIEGKRYYFDENGFLWTKEKGWLTIGRNKYYMQDDNSVHQGFLELEEENGIGVYYLTNNGQMVKGWRTINRHRYYFDSVTGKQLFGHQKVGKYWYYFDTDVEGESAYPGAKRELRTVKTLYADGNRYEFYMIKDASCLENGKMYCIRDGKELLKGKYTIKQTEYVFHEDTGELLTG